MTVTVLDPKTALIVIDLQKGVMTMPTAHPMGGVLASSKLLIDAFRSRGWPIVLVNVTGGAPGRTERKRSLDGLPADWADLVPEVGAQAGDMLITKKTWGAFTNTELEARLRALGVTQVVIIGVATSIGVESTARQAFELGFNVTLAVDAMTDMNHDAHDNSVTRIFPRLGETGTAEEIAGLIGRA